MPQNCVSSLNLAANELD